MGCCSLVIGWWLLELFLCWSELVFVVVVVAVVVVVVVVVVGVVVVAFCFCWGYVFPVLGGPKLLLKAIRKKTQFQKLLCFVFLGEYVFSSAWWTQTTVERYTKKW